MSWNTDASANKFVQSYVKGFVDISGGDLLLRNGSIRFADGTIQSSANRTSNDISGNCNISGNLNVAGTERITQDLFVGGNVSITGSLITETYTFKNRNNTARVTGYIPNTTQMAYSDISGTLNVNDYVAYGTPNFTVTGDTGIQVNSIDTTNKLITFTGALTIPPAYDISKNGYITATNKIQLLDSTGVVAGQGVKMNGVTINQSYVASVDASKNIILPSNSATLPTATSQYGYIDSSNNLIFTQDVSAGFYYTGPGLPASGLTYTRTNITSRSCDLSNNLGQAITSSNSFNAGVGAVYSSTEIVLSLSPAGSAPNNFFINANPANCPRGSRIGSTGGTNSRYIVIKEPTALPLTPASPVVSGVYGYINGTTLTLDSLTGLATYQIIKGTGAPAASTANCFISSANGTNSTVTMGGAGTTANSVSISGYIYLPGSFIVSPSTSVGANKFLTGTGITGRCKTISQNGGLVTTNYTAAMTPTAYTDLSGSVISSSQFYVTGGTPVVGRFVDVSYGMTITAYDVSKGLVTVSPSIATPVSIQKYGWISSSTTLELFDLAGGVTTKCAVTGTGITDTKPYITSITGTTCTLANTTMTPTSSTTREGYILQGSPYKLILKTDISTNTFVSGTGFASTALTTSSGKGVTFNTNGAVTATTPYYSNNKYYIPATNKVSLITTIPNQSYMLYDNSGVFQDGTYISDISGYHGTVVGQTLTPTPQYATLNCAVVADPSGGYLLYAGSRLVNPYSFAYNINTFSQAGYANGTRRLQQLAYNITFAGTPVLTTKALNGAVGFYYTDNTIIIPNTTTNLNALNSINGGAMIEVGTDLSNNVAMYTGFYYDNKPPVYRGLWISVSYPSGSNMTLPTQAYSASNTYGRPYSTSDYTRFYVGNVNGGLPTSVGDFIIFNNTTLNLAGIRIVSVTPIVNPSPPYAIDDWLIQMDSAVEGLTGGTACYFYVQKTINIYNNHVMSLYNSSSLSAFVPNTYTCAQGSQYTVYSAVPPIRMYAPSTYTLYDGSTYDFYATQTISFYSDLSYNFSQYTPQLVTLYQPQQVQFYRINYITVPATSDTMCVLNYPQTLTNKTLSTNTTLTGSTIVLDMSNNSIKATNSSGTQQDFLWPRYSGDNATYMNYGAGGFYLRNNSSTTVMQFNSADNFYLFGNQFRYVNWTQAYSTFNTAVGASATSGAVAPTSGTQSIFRYYYSVIGNTMFIQFFFNQTAAGSAGSGVYYVKMPSGYTIDTTNITGSSDPTVSPSGNWYTWANLGMASLQAFGTSNYHGCVAPVNSTGLGIVIDMGWANTMWDSNSYPMSVAALHIAFSATVPLA